MKGTKGHRERKNGASHEQWMERKAEVNAARPPQIVVENETPDDIEGVKRVRE